VHADKFGVIIVALLAVDNVGAAEAITCIVGNEASLPKSSVRLLP
jgi:hypothetical protein